MSEDHKQLMKKETLGTILALVTALISGLAIPINKIFVVGLDPTVFTAVRALFIGIIFFFLAFGAKSKRKNVKKIPWKHLIAIALIGGSFAFLMFFTGLKLTTAGRGAFLHKTLPLYITIFAFLFLKEKISQKQVLALTLMIIGTVLIYSAKITTSEFWLNPSLGDLLVIGATVLWAIENTIARKVMIDGESNFVVSFARMFLGAIILFAIIILQDKMSLLFSLTMLEIINLTISIAILFGYVFCWYWSIKLINVSKASTILLLAPVISLILGMIIFNEPVPNLQLLGSALVLVGAYFVVKIKSEFTTGV
jgi:drug/metabolite transporter (DMT)-like permease